MGLSGVKLVDYFLEKPAGFVVNATLERDTDCNSGSAHDQ